MENLFTIIGFGEAGRTFSGHGDWASAAQVFDKKSDDAQLSSAIKADYQKLGVSGKASLQEALSGAQFVISLVTADQALIAAQDAAQHIQAGALFFDMNSVSPDTKRAAAKAIEAAGAHYVDTAVMAPVDPKALSVPLLVSGEKAAQGEAILRKLGFGNIRNVGLDVGRASTVKMVRSVMIKGIEALTAECVFAAQEGGVLDDVLDCLGGDWADKANYNFDRMMIHGLRRAAEMREVEKTLTGLGIAPELTRGTVDRQHAIGALGLKTPPDDLAGKLDLISKTQKKGADA